MNEIPSPIRSDLGVGASPVVPISPIAAAALDALKAAWIHIGLGVADATSPSVAAGAVCAADAALDATGTVIISGERTIDVRGAATLRDHLWPALHVTRVYLMKRGEPIERLGIHGGTRLDARAERDGYVVTAMRRVHAMSPEVTAEKFDGTAAGWNGDPESPAYGHFRWMRRLLAVLARPRPGERVLDAGSGAGWVGLEAALMGARLSAFDPSPEMVRFVERNAKELGVDVDARVGFMERPPFDEPFDLVLNSGVISFAPDPDVFLDGLDPLVKPGGRLVIGDINPRSRGFRRRRRDRPILPSRELNGLPRETMIRKLEARGYRVEFVRYYQSSWPFPELLFKTKRKLVGWIILQWNRLASAADAAFGSRMASRFDSWIVGARKPENRED